MYFQHLYCVHLDGAGLTLLPVLRGESRPIERTFFWRIDRADRKQKAVRKGDWKYVRDGSIELLFDLVKDPGERKDLGYQHPKVLAELRSLMDEWEKEMAQEKPAFVVK